MMDTVAVHARQPAAEYVPPPPPPAEYADNRVTNCLANLFSFFLNRYSAARPRQQGHRSATEVGRDRVQGEARQHRQLHEHPAHERARVHRPEVHERPGPDSDSVRLTFLFLFDLFCVRPAR